MAKSYFHGSPYKPPNNLLQIPRFGHGRNLIYLVNLALNGDGDGDVSEERDKKRDYLLGVASFSIFLIAVLAVWILLLLIFSFLGKKRVGWLSGTYSLTSIETSAGKNEGEKMGRNGIVHDESSIDDSKIKKFPGGDETDSNDESKGEHGSSLETRKSSIRHLIIWRSLFVACGVLFVVNSLIFASVGLRKLQLAVDTVNDFSSLVSLLGRHSIEFLTRSYFRNMTTFAKGATHGIEEELNRAFCPGNPTLSDGEIYEQFQVFLVALRDKIDPIADLTRSVNPAAIEDMLHTLVMAAESAEKTTSSVNLAGWWALLSVSLYTLVATLLVASAVVSWHNALFPIFSVFIRCVFFPMFILLTMIAWFFSAIFSLAYSVNYDLCLPEAGEYSDKSAILDMPDYSVLELIKQIGREADTSLHEASKSFYDRALYYVSFCSLGDNPFNVFESYETQLDVVYENLSRLHELIVNDASFEELSVYCNRDTSTLSNLPYYLRSLFFGLRQLISKVLNLSSCNIIVPLYENIVYVGACNYSLSAFNLMFTTSLVIAIAGLSMITLRAFLITL